jgi:hypothetical protein
VFLDLLGSQQLNFAGADLTLHPGPLGDVADRGKDPSAFVQFHGREGDLDRKLASVLSPRSAYTWAATIGEARS